MKIHLLLNSQLKRRIMASFRVINCNSDCVENMTFSALPVIIVIIGLTAL
jgi:hypothetical protein